MTHIDLVQLVSFLIAASAQFSRLFVATRPMWSRFPGWLQTLLPPAVPFVAALAQGLLGVHTWTDLGVVLLGCVALLVPGLPSNRSAATLQAGKAPTLTPSASDAAVARTMVAAGSIAPPAPIAVGA